MWTVPKGALHAPRPPTAPSAPPPTTSSTLAASRVGKAASAATLLPAKTAMRLRVLFSSAPTAPLAAPSFRSASSASTSPPAWTALLALLPTVLLLSASPAPRSFLTASSAPHPRPALSATKASTPAGLPAFPVPMAVRSAAQFLCAIDARRDFGSATHPYVCPVHLLCPGVLNAQLRYSAPGACWDFTLLLLPVTPA